MEYKRKRKEIVGKRFVCVKNPNKKVEIAEWEWRSGVIRAVSADPPSNPQNKVRFLLVPLLCGKNSTHQVEACLFVFNLTPKREPNFYMIIDEMSPEYEPVSGCLASLGFCIPWHAKLWTQL